MNIEKLKHWNLNSESLKQAESKDQNVYTWGHVKDNYDLSN